MKKHKLEKIEPFNNSDFSKFENINKYNAAITNKDTAFSMMFVWTVTNIITTFIGYSVAKHFFNVTTFTFYDIAYYYICTAVCLISILFTLCTIGAILSFGFIRGVIVLTIISAAITLIEEHLITEPIKMPDIDKIAMDFMSNDALVITAFFALFLTPFLFNLIKYFRNHKLATYLYSAAQEELEIAVAQAFKRAEAKEKERKYKAEQKAKNKARKEEQKRKEAEKAKNNTTYYDDDFINDFSDEDFEEFCRRCEAEEKRKQRQASGTSNVFEEIFIVNGDNTFMNCRDKNSLKKTYHKEAMKIHPDITGENNSDMTKLNVTYNTILERLEQFEKCGYFAFK